MIVNSILVGGIAILVVSLVFTFCAKITDKDDVKNDIQSFSDELLTLESGEVTLEPTEEPIEHPTGRTTEDPTEPLSGEVNPADLISVYVPTNFAVDYDNSAHKLNLQNYGDYVTEVVADLDGYVDFEL